MQSTWGVPFLTPDQMERYSRHTRLAEVGVEGQKRLLDARVLIVGAGGLGSPAALYLAAAGVGTIGIVDGDVVDRSNLQRQVIHDDASVGMPKTESARRHIEALNSDVRVIAYQTVLDSQNALEILADYDVVVNGCDNFPTRYLLSDACVLLRKPLVDAAILRFEGQATVYEPGKGCYRCLFPTPPPPGSVPSCAEVGIIGALAGQMGTLQAMETIKLILGIGRTLSNRLYIYDALAVEHHVVRWERRPDCPACGDNPTITALVDYKEFCGVPVPHAIPAPPAPGGGLPQAASGVAAPRTPATGAGGETADVTPLQAVELLGRGAQLIDVREAHEYEREHIDRSRLIPLGELAWRSEEIDPERPAILVCEVGERSGRAVRALRDAGFEHVYNLAGGIIAWVNWRLPVVRRQRQHAT
ncbi:MAG: molybdopterin-synthase adenylyltransferase MoeB [Bacillota bacterium]|nr:molybdopterin-synthase adenylyltransferase MoeB [Bacillota bacterium]